MYIRCVLLCSYCLAVTNALAMRYAPVAITFSCSPSPTASYLFMRAKLDSNVKMMASVRAIFAKQKARNAEHEATSGVIKALRRYLWNT